MSTGSFDIAVVGGGIAALTAAYHASDAGGAVALLADSDPLGGLVMNVGELDGFPSIGRAGGAELAQRLAEQVGARGVEIIRVRVDRLAGEGGSRLLHAGPRQWRARAVIAATGARLRPFEAPGAERFRDQGLLQCAWCNAGLYRGRHVVVVGGGDSALQEALHLADSAASVTILARGERLRARQSYVSRAADRDNIAFRWSTEIQGIIGREGVEAVQLLDRQTGEVETLPCDAVFAYVGLVPNSDWLGDLVERDECGAVSTGNTLETRAAGVFAVGALRSGYAGRLTNAVGEATEAAIRVSAMLEA